VFQFTLWVDKLLLRYQLHCLCLIQVFFIIAIVRGIEGPRLINNWAILNAILDVLCTMPIVALVCLN